MSNEAHTPGPWVFENRRGVRAIRPNGGDGHALLCDERYYPWCPDDDADWRLIAAAPELLAALNSTTLALERLVFIEPGSPAAHTVAKARAAIAKATGSAA